MRLWPSKWELVLQRPRPGQPTIRSSVAIGIVGSLLAGIIFIGVATFYESKDDAPPIRIILTIVRELGVALIIAACVSILFHMREFKEFFEESAASVMLEDRFLARLESDELRRMRQRTAKELVSRSVGSPTYDHERLSDVVDSAIFDRALPGGNVSGEYRIEFEERYYLTWISRQDLIAELGLSGDRANLLPAGKDRFLKRVSITAYQVVSPLREPDPYKIPLEFEIAALSNAAELLDKQVTLWAGESEASAQQIVVGHRAEPNGEMTFFPAKAVSCPYRQGKASVWYRAIDYGLADLEPFQLSTMEVATQPKVGVFATITFDGNSTATAKCRVLGVGGTYKLDLLPHGAQLSYDGGWFLAKQGYVWWW